MNPKGKVRVAFWVNVDDLEEMRELARQLEVPQSRMMDRGVRLALNWYKQREELITKGIEADVE